MIKPGLNSGLDSGLHWIQFERLQGLVSYFKLKGYFQTIVGKINVIVTLRFDPSHLRHENIELLCT